ncbi:MAG: hypothetical protein Q8L66_06845 [Caulobacter sp.]|nr:hypothetical protein [Caulobacter sp.]
MQDQSTEPGALPIALAALIAALIYAFGLYGLTNLVRPDSGMAVVGFLLGAPFACCGLASLIVGFRRDLSLNRHMAISAIVVTAMLLAAGVILREGSICLVMAAPLFYGLGLLGGVLVGALLKRRSRGTTAACSLAVCLPLLVLPVESSMVYPEQTGSVTSVMLIDAPPAAVWANTVELRAIRSDELSPDVSHTLLGVPQPVDARLEGQGVGAVRHIEWRRGLHFEEVVTAWSPGRALQWRFAFQPDSIPPALDRRINMNSDYLRLEGGEYRFEALPDGRTRLTLETRYWLKTPINGYCDAWANLFLNDMHGAVLRVIKARSEAA